VANCDPNTLLTNARCIEDCLMGGQMDAIETYLWCVRAGSGVMTFYILAENSDILNAENSDRLRKE